MTVPRIHLTPATGPAGAPLLVLGPSLGTSTILWDDVVPALAWTHRVVAWDLPGHGASPAASDAFTMGELADAVANAVADLGERRVRYAGVSIGGATGLELMLRHPELVTEAAIVASGAQLGTPDSWHERSAQVREQSTSSLIIASAQRWFAPDSIARRPEATGRLLHVLQQADDESYALACEALAAYDVRDRLDAIEAPVLAAWGEHDRVAPEARAHEIAAGVRRGRASRIDGAAHLPPAEQPEAVADLLLRFFAEAGVRADEMGATDASA
ncbi:alpha/beta fold hydrolase [Agromyces sp. CF514]|uniref:alpha/beta fold hydrolase n=1 Tax=Agromyces sp. CF514 TaxID=1881031 RepID=UPI000A7D33C2|nr:alpha/beta fold hydrolase [Agromyces sp. CF514]